MKIQIPRIEIVESSGENVGILTDYPATMRFSPAIRELLGFSQDGILDVDGAISSLGDRFNVSELNDAINELKDLLRGIRGREELKWDPQLVSALYLDLPENDLKAADLINRAVSFFEPQFSRTVHLTLSLKSPVIFPSVSHLCKKLMASKKHSYTLLFQIPIEIVDRQFVDFVLSSSCEVKLLFRYGDDPRAALKHIPVVVKRLISNRVVSARIDGPPIPRDAAMETLHALKLMGIGLIQFGYGKCDVFNESPKVWHHIQSNGYFSAGEASIAEIVGHQATLNSFTPRTFACGAGRWYRAVSQDGEIFPCHGLIGESRFCLGSVEITSIDHGSQKKFAPVSVQDREECADCWAKFICGGGCIAQWEKDHRHPSTVSETRCNNIRGNIKTAALLSADRGAAGRLLLQKNIDFLQRHNPQFPYVDGRASEDTLVLSTVGQSMFPLFKSRTELRIEFLHPDQIKTGDIFSYIRNNKIITHRFVLRINLMSNSYIYEKGDNGFFQEVNPNEIVGRITHFKNEGMLNFIPTKSLPLKLAGKIIALYSVLSWAFIFVMKYGFSYVRHLFRARFNFRDSVRRFTAAQKFALKSQRILDVLNFPVKQIDRLLLLTYKIKELSWRR